jgi:hypothetical protein
MIETESPWFIACWTTNDDLDWSRHHHGLYSSCPDTIKIPSPFWGHRRYMDTKASWQERKYILNHVTLLENVASIDLSNGKHYFNSWMCQSAMETAPFHYHQLKRRGYCNSQYRVVQKCSHVGIVRSWKLVDMHTESGNGNYNWKMNEWNALSDLQHVADKRMIWNGSCKPWTTLVE